MSEYNNLMYKRSLKTAKPVSNGRRKPSAPPISYGGRRKRYEGGGKAK